MTTGREPAGGGPAGAAAAGGGPASRGPAADGPPVGAPAPAAGTPAPVAGATAADPTAPVAGGSAPGARASAPVAGATAPAAAGAAAAPGGGSSGRAAVAEEDAIFGLASVSADETVAYGDHPDQIVDLYHPSGAAEDDRAPLVLLLHGGFWRQAYDRSYLTPCAAELARRGLPVALAEYRRVGGAGGWPETFDDVDAVRGAVRHHPLAAGRPLVVVGHSAGGHLALWTAAAEPELRVVAVAPVADLAHAHRLGLSNGAVAELLGGPDRVAELLPLTDPVRMLPARAPVTILHGTADPDVPLELSRRYVAAAAREAEDGATRPVLHELPGVGHFAPFTPGTPSFHRLLDALA